MSESMEIVKLNKVDFSKLMQQPEQYIILLTESQYMKLVSICEKAAGGRIPVHKSSLVKLAGCLAELIFHQHFTDGRYLCNGYVALYFKRGNDRAKDELIKTILKEKTKRFFMESVP